jgi:lysophospholipase L1-like esterase
MTDWYEPEVRELEQVRPNIACPVVFYGSSTIRLWPRLGRDGRVVNRGFGGSTIEACDYYFERLVVPLHPRSLVIYAGDNDLGDGRSPEQVLTWFQQLAAKIEKRLPGVPFGFISIKLSPARMAIAGRIRRANDLVLREIPRHPAAYFIPIADAMLGPNGQPRPELFLGDGLHLSLAGYRLWEQLLVPFENRIFTPLSDDCNKRQLFLSHGESGVQEVVQPTLES